MKFNITPNVGVNGVLFGAERNKVRSVLGAYSEFKKSPFSKNTADDFGQCHVFYDSENRFQAIEFFGGEVYIGDKKIFPATIDQAKNIIPDLTSDDSGFLSVSQSAGIYAPAEKIESILFGKDGYYA
jgi:hypothetical protein